ncbi:hypothetical protein [Mycobacterium tuberculosis]|uniref:hypothetical protein n=1 Tax=Mycobacterium tuberculosis TaxID=1773 RepID=UPI00350F171D
MIPTEEWFFKPSSSSNTVSAPFDTKVRSLKLMHGEDQDRRTRARKAIEAAGFCGFDWGGGVIQVFRTDLLKITDSEEARWPHKLRLCDRHQP